MKNFYDYLEAVSSYLKEETEDSAERFYVNVTDDEGNNFNIEVRKMDGRWVEKLDAKARKFHAPKTYMGYLSEQDIIDWLRKDFNEVYLVDGDDDDDLVDPKILIPKLGKELGLDVIVNKETNDADGEKIWSVSLKGADDYPDSKVYTKFYNKIEKEYPDMKYGGLEIWV